MGQGYENPAGEFQHSRLRLGRARKRIIELNEATNVWVQENKPRLRRDFDSRTGWTTYKLGIRGKPPKSFAIEAGAVAEDLRGALDLLVAGLRTTGNADNPPRFPICQHAGDYHGEGGPGARSRFLGDLDSADRARIDALQPYHRVNSARDPLARLLETHQSYLKRKLRSTLILCERPTANFKERDRGTVRQTEARRCDPGVRAKSGMEVLGYRVWPDPSAPVKVDIDLRFDLRLDPPEVSMSELDRIRIHVESIVDGFDTRLAAA